MWLLFMFLFVTDRIRSTREGNVLTRVRPSIILSVLRGDTPARSSQRGTPPWVPPCQTWPGGTLPGGTPHWVPICLTWPGHTSAGGRGVPHLGCLLSDLARGGTPAGGYPSSGTPHKTCPGVPLLRGSPARGYPTSGTPPLRPGQGGTPPQVTDGVLDTPWSVCLLRSHRRTFLLKYRNKWMSVKF